MDKNQRTFIAREKNRIRRRFLFLSLAIALSLAAVIILVYRFIQYVPVAINDEVLRETLILLPTVLGAMLVVVFAIPVIKDVFDYPVNRRATVIVYLSWLIFCIVFPVLQIENLLTPTAFLCKIDFVLFIITLLAMIPYVLIFIHSSRYSVLISLFNSAALPYVFPRLKLGIRTVERTQKRITSISHLIVSSLYEHDHKSLSIGLKKLRLLGVLIIDSTNLSRANANSLFKSLLSSYRYIAAESLKGEDIDNVHVALSELVRVLKHGIDNEIKGADDLEYAFGIVEIKRVIISCIHGNAISEVADMIDLLGQLGESSQQRKDKHPLSHPPDMEILTTLQEIGIECARRRFENLCIETLVRLMAIALPARGNANKVYVKSLKCHWVLSSYLIKWIPEAKSWLLKMRSKMEEEGILGDYDSAYITARKELIDISCEGEIILLEYGKMFDLGME